ncbi:porin [Chromobacterium haemolyticum]|nr:porin [Chromobacterium haemolyticum]
MPRLPLLPGLAASLFLPVACAEPFLMSRLYGLPQYNGMLKNGGVAMYGSMDLGINYQQAGGHRKWQVQSGGEWTSKIGIFGRELLGNGWKAEFNNWRPASMPAPANRNCPASPSTANPGWGLEVPGLGAVRLGRQLAAGLPLFVDVFGAVGTNSAYSWAGMGAVQTPGGLRFNGDLGAGSTQAEPRVGNAIKWISPRWRGFNIDVLHAAAERSDRPALSSRGMVLSHISGPRYLAASYNQTWQPLDRGGPDNVRNDFYGLGAVYDSGSLVLSSSFKLDLPRRRENGIAQGLHLGRHRAVPASRLPPLRRLPRHLRRAQRAAASDGQLRPRPDAGLRLRPVQAQRALPARRRHSQLRRLHPRAQRPAAARRSGRQSSHRRQPYGPLHRDVSQLLLDATPPARPCISESHGLKIKHQRRAIDE